MSNESRNRLVMLASDVRTGDSCRTFVFHEEGHTLGNALRSIILRYPEVQFCGYTIPHPAENSMHLRIQTNGVPALEILTRGLEDLEAACDHTLTVFQKEIHNFKASQQENT